MINVIARLKNLGVFIRAYGAALTTRRAPSATPHERILLVPAGKLGDVVCTTPVMRAIREHFPHAALFIREFGGVNEALLADSGLADGYLLATTVDEYVATLKRERIDTVLITGPSLEDVAAALIARVPTIVAPRVVGGYCPQYIRPYRALLRFITTFTYTMEEYAPRERLRVLEPLGIRAEDTRKHLGFSTQARATIERFLASEGIVAPYAIISPSAGNKIKQWPAERFARVAEHIARTMPVVVIGTKRDREEVEAMMSALTTTTRIRNASERFSLDELKALVAGAALFVSVDTGPLYIAEAFGVPTVDIIGPIDEREQPPRGPYHRNVLPPGRTKPELYVLNARHYNEQEALRQIDSITVPLVTDTIDQLLKDLPPRP